jgi:hypothetical protein
MVDDHSDAADSADAHAGDGQGEAGGGWILGVLLAAVVVFAVAGLLIGVVGDGGDGGDGSADAATTTTPQDRAPVTAEAPTTNLAGPTSTTVTTAPPSGGASTSTTAAAGTGGSATRPGGAGADAAESSAASTFARLVRSDCDVARVADPDHVRSKALGSGLYQITDAAGVTLILDTGTGVVRSADSLDGSVPGGYEDACRPALLGR